MTPFRPVRIAFLITLPLLLPVAEVYAQEDREAVVGVQTPEVPDTLRGWDLQWRAGLNLAQAAYSNWSTGGINSYHLTSTSRIRIMYQRERFAYDFQIRSRYGQARVQDEGQRKTEDRLQLRHRFLYDISDDDEEFKLFGNINFETQFSEGFDYGGGPDGEDLLISDFFAPAYFNQSAGLAWFPGGNFSVDAGIGLRQTFVRNELLSERFGMEPGQTFRLESGIALGINYEREVMEDIHYHGQIETFTNILRSIDESYVYLSNQIVGRVNDHVDLLFQVDLAYDTNFSRNLQVAQSFSAGIAVNIY